MSIYGITGVKLDEKGNVIEAAICGIDGATNDWIGSPTVRAASDIADMILSGDEVFGIFSTQGLHVPGPKFCYVVFPGGDEGITLCDDVDGKRLTDLVQLV